MPPVVGSTVEVVEVITTPTDPTVLPALLAAIFGSPVAPLTGDPSRIAGDAAA